MLRADPARSRYRISERERDWIEAVRNTVTRDFAEALKIYRRRAKSASPGESTRSLVELGRALEHAKQPAEALKQYEAAIRVDGNDAGAFLGLAGVAAQLQRWDRWTQALESAESLFQAASNQEGLTEVYYQRGASANRRARLAEASDWLERARRSAEVTRNPYEEIRALYQLSAVAYQKGNTQAGQTLAEEAIREARANSIEFLAGRGFYDLANSFYTRGDYAKAIDYYNDALRIALQYHNDRLKFNVFYAQGAMAIRTHGDEAGAKQVEQALAWFQANRYPYEASLCAVTLGRFQRNRGDLIAALSTFNRQLDLARAARDDLQTALALSSVASVLIRQENYPKALSLIRDQLAMSRRMGDGLQIGYGLESLARVYAELGRFGESAAALEEGEEWARAGKIDELLANLEVERARGLLLAGRVADAASTARRGIAAYEATYPQPAGELLKIRAEADATVAFGPRLEWFEKAFRMSEGSASAQLSARLAEAGARLRSGDAQGAISVCEEIISWFERQQLEYSLFRAEVINGSAKRRLRQDGSVAAGQAEAALGRFRQRFDESAWNGFRTRPDFNYWGRKLRQLQGH
jgi:tetratricopeptide (TPR) repeat protein